MAAPATQKLNERTRGWLRHLWRKATTEDDWSSRGEPIRFGADVLLTYSPEI